MVAAAGYGKSALLEQERPADGVVLPATRAAAAVTLPSNGWVGIDRLDDLSAEHRARLLQLVSETVGQTVTLTARMPLDPGLRDSLRGQVLVRGPSDLALDPYAVACCLAHDHGVSDPETAVRVAELTAGWPALVHYAGDALSRDRQTDLDELFASPEGVVARWLRREVLDPLPPGVRRLLSELAGLGPVTESLCAGLADEGHQDPDDAVAAFTLLRDLGLLVPVRRLGSVHHVLVPALEGLMCRLRDVPEVGEPRVADRWTVSARVHEADGRWIWAARARLRGGDGAAAARLVAEHSEGMLRQGDFREIVAAARAVEPMVGTRLAHVVQRTLADALRRAGDLSAASRAFAPLAEVADELGWSSGMAARVAQLHYTRGEFTAALDVLDRVVPPTATVDEGVATMMSQDDPEDAVDWLATRIHVLSVLGRRDEAVTVADLVLRFAEASGLARALGVAHLAAARVAVGARKQLHHEAALRFATDAGDSATAARVVSAQTHQLLAEARYGDAVVAARESVRLAELSSPPGLRAVALHNLAEALARTGDFVEASWHLERSISICRRLGPSRAALGLVGLGDLHRELGRDEQSRAAYLEAAELARGSGDTQVLVASLSGLARLLAQQSPGDGNDVGRTAAEEARSVAGPALLPLATIALGWVRVAEGDRQAAVVLARRAVESAREVRAVDLLAEALELWAATTDSASDARAALQEALSIWEFGGAVTAAWRIQVLLGRLRLADAVDRSRAREAARRLQRLGITTVHGQPVIDAPAGTPVVIEVLGGFRVVVEGTEVPLQAWRSRQARTLVTVLAGRRGRVVTRAQLCELLWPDDDPARTGHRLSVLLATVRGVLDPGKAWPSDHYVAADQYGIRLDLRHVSVDADAFLRDADQAAELVDRGLPGDEELAREILSYVDARYRGEALDDEAEQQFSEALREEVRDAWVRSARRLATLHGRQGRTGDALSLLVRLLGVDPYDEQVHRRRVTLLIRAGRHGEARRAFDRWATAMRDIDAPEPDASVLRRGAAVLTPR